jgi:hypothetical protein
MLGKIADGYLVSMLVDVRELSKKAQTIVNGTFYGNTVEGSQ